MRGLPRSMVPVTIETPPMQMFCALLDDVVCCACYCMPAAGCYEAVAAACCGLLVVSCSTCLPCHISCPACHTALLPSAGCAEAVAAASAAVSAAEGNQVDSSQGRITAWQQQQQKQGCCPSVAVVTRASCWMAGDRVALAAAASAARWNSARPLLIIGKCYNKVLHLQWSGAGACG
jgi:hypothetical protein